MADVFLSYASQDRPHAVTTAEALESQGYSVWWDASLVAGQVYPQTIKAEILSASAVVVMWSHHAKDSEWVYSEALQGSQQGKLICTHLDGFDPKEVPMPFDTRHAIPIADMTRLRQAVSLLAPTPEAEHGGLSSNPADYSWWHSDESHGHYTQAFCLALDPSAIEWGKARPEDYFAFVHAAKHGAIQAFELYLEAWPDGAYRPLAMHFINVTRVKIREFAQQVSSWLDADHMDDAKREEWIAEYHTDGVIRGLGRAFPLDEKTIRFIRTGKA